jgi:hypothetical protein
MTDRFFEKQMGILWDVFSKTEYPPVRVEMIWKNCKDLPDVNFENIIKFFISTKPIKFPPLPNDFIEEANRQRAMLINGSNSRNGWRSEIDNLQPAGEVLQDILKQNNVTSITEIIKNKKYRQLNKA